MSTDERAGVLHVRNIRKHLGQTVITSSNRLLSGLVLKKTNTPAAQSRAVHRSLTSSIRAPWWCIFLLIWDLWICLPQLVTFGRHRLHRDDCWSVSWRTSSGVKPVWLAQFTLFQDEDEWSAPIGCCWSNGISHASAGPRGGARHTFPSYSEWFTRRRVQNNKII